VGLFSKVEYKEIYLPFTFNYNKEDINGDFIDIEAYGLIDEEMKYCYASYGVKDTRLYYNGAFEEMITNIQASTDKNLLIKLKYKKGRLKDFRIDIDYLADICNDERMKYLDLLCWGMDDKSYIELMTK